MHIRGIGLAQVVIRCVALVAAAYCSPAFSMEEKALSEFLQSARDEMRLPGLRAAVRYPDGRMVRAAVGLADKKAKIPLDDDVGMPGGSTGKPFVAALTMLLVEDGILSLDDPAKKWLGDTDWYERLPNSDDILIRHLLSHSSGLRDYPGKPSFILSMVGRVIRHGSAYFEPEELIRFAGKRPLFPAGEGYAYSDAGYLVLGRVIEAASGESYYDLLTERILTPQGLSQIRPQDQSALPNITPGYQNGASNLKKDGRMKLDPRSEWTGGGLVTTPTGLVEFFAALAEGRIVRPDSLTQMLESGWHDPNGPGYHYGFGLFVDDNGSWFSHGGKWVGYRTHVAHIVPTGITVAVQTNRDDHTDMIGLITRVAELAEEDN